MKSSPTTTPFLLALTLAALAPLAARADVIPPWEMACYGRKAGEPCSDQPGTCLKAKCQRSDYAHWDQAASPNGPPQIFFDCNTCFEDAGSPSSPAKDPGDAGPAHGSDAGDAATLDAAGDAPSSGNDAGDAAPPSISLGGDSTAPARAGDAATNPTADVSTGAPGTTSEEASDDGGGCSLGDGHLAHDLGPWLLAGSFALLIGRRKRY